MTEGLTCSNCGGPVTRKGGETRVTCPHCEHVMEVAPLPSAAPPAYHDDRMRPIVVIREPVIHEAPIVIVRSGTTVVRRSSSVAPFVTSLIFVLFAIGVSAFVHMRAVRLASQVPAAAERAAEKAEKAVEKSERKPTGHH